MSIEHAVRKRNADAGARRAAKFRRRGGGFVRPQISSTIQAGTTLRRNMMNDLATNLQQTVEAAAAHLLAVSELAAEASGSEGRWSAKEILGHLIDSAANNHQRFVRAQATDDLMFAGYEQEYWVGVQHYREIPWPHLVQFWLAYNRHLAHVIAHIPPASLAAPRSRHTLDKIAWQTVDPGTPTTLAYLIADYIGHLKMHLQQIDEVLAT
jgi:hypothetical protein